MVRYKLWKLSYVTSSVTLPYGACSLGFPPQLIKTIYGAVKIYDTRSGLDPDFPESLLQDEELLKIANIGKEYGTTTGRRRKVNWLNVNKLIDSINISGTTVLIISKVDVLEEAQLFKIINDGKIIDFKNLSQLKEVLNKILKENCSLLEKIIYSNNPEKIEELS